jgi:hypothetical protein
MREETRKRLERTLWLERAKKAGIGVAILAAVGLFFLYEDYDAHVEKIRVPGTIVSIGPINTTSSQAIENGLSVDVALKNGRRVTVWVLKKRNPHVGDQVEITEHLHRTGRVNYSWK